MQSLSLHPSRVQAKTIPQLLFLWEIILYYIERYLYVATIFEEMDCEKRVITLNRAGCIWSCRATVNAQLILIIRELKKYIVTMRASYGPSHWANFNYCCGCFTDRTPFSYAAVSSLLCITHERRSDSNKGWGMSRGIQCARSTTK